VATSCEIRGAWAATVFCSRSPTGDASDLVHPRCRPVGPTGGRPADLVAAMLAIGGPIWAFSERLPLYPVLPNLAHFALGGLTTVRMWRTVVSRCPSNNRG